MQFKFIAHIGFPFYNLEDHFRPENSVFLLDAKPTLLSPAMGQTHSDLTNVQIKMKDIIRFLFHYVV